MGRVAHELFLSGIGPHLAQFVARIERGNMPLATISLVKYHHSQEVKKAVREIAVLRRKCSIDFQTYKELKNEGRK